MRPNRRTSRLTTAGVAVTAATLLAAAFSTGASAASAPQTQTGTRAAHPTPDRATAIRNANAASSAHAAQLALTAAQQTSVRDVIVDADGSQHVRYDRTFRQLPVLGGDFVVHLSPAGAYRGADRAVTNDLS